MDEAVLRRNLMEGGLEERKLPIVVTEHIGCQDIIGKVIGTGLLLAGMVFEEHANQR